MNNFTYNDLKKFIENNDFENTCMAIIYLYIDDKEKFVNKLLMIGCIPEPLSRNFSKDKYDFFKTCCEAVIKSFDSFNSDFTTEFRYHIIKLFITIDNLMISNKSNQSRLFKNEFLKVPFTKQVQMWATYIESQAYYADKKTQAEISEKGFIAGLEQEIAESEFRVSISDIMEGNLEIFDTLLRLLHYISRDKIDNQKINYYKDISPYNIPSIKEILHLTLHRGYLEEFWAKFKYRKWDFVTIKSENGKYIYYYKPINSEDYKKERAAIIRYKYRDYNSYAKKMNYKLLSKSIDYVKEKTDFSLETFDSVFELDNHIFNNARNIVRIQIDVGWSQLEEDIGSLIHTISIGIEKDIEIKEVIIGIEYLFSLAYVYRTNSHSKFDDTDFSYLTPVFEIKQLSKHFAYLYNLDQCKAEKIIDLFVFYPNPLLDIFSQPLIYSGNGRVVFVPFLITQMNINRIINQHLTKWDIDISAKGHEMEEQLKFILKFSKHFQVNLKPVKFDAYDGKEVEYDLIATFDSKIFLVELKSLVTPFSPKEYVQREKDILYGVEQVNRREDILIKEWEKVQSIIEIPLPHTPPRKEDIVKIVCTNILDFTGRRVDDVYITDISSFIKFFLNPEVLGVQVSIDSKEVVSENKLWNEKPTLKEFEEYLKEPIAVKWIIDNLKETPRYIQSINPEDPALAFEDYVLDSNPLEKESFKKSTKINRKIGRNEICPCGSGIKYKRCHGRG